MASCYYVVVVFMVLSLRDTSCKTIRRKRNVDASIQSVLQSFLRRIGDMKILIRKQDNMINEQNRAIKRLGWTLRNRGTQERLSEIDRDLKHQFVLLRSEAKLPTLTEFKNTIEKSNKKIQGVIKSIKARSKTAREIYDRIIMRDSRIDCKIFYTKWNKQAGDRIGSLTKHSLKCPNQEFMQSFLLQRKDGGFDSEIRYKFRCCRYNIKDKWVSRPI